MITAKVAIGVVALGAVVIAVNQLHWRGTVDESARGRESAKVLGYLSPAILPNLVPLLPPPPKPGSMAMERDERARQGALLLKGTPLYAIAAADAVRAQPNTVAGFECAFGTGIDMKRTPTLYNMLSRIRLDVRAASYAAKRHFARPRPFALNNVHSCYRDDEDMVRNDGSYPSARGSVGWAFAIVLAHLRPERRHAIVGRAHQFAQSRVVCDQEWQSDVDAARTVALVVVSRELTQAAFRTDMAVARNEVAAELALGVKPAAVCEGNLPG